MKRTEPLKKSLLMKRDLIFVIVGVCVGIGASFAFLRFAGGRADETTSVSRPLRRYDANFPHINPLLACVISNTKPSSTFTDIKKEIEDVIVQKQTSGLIEGASVYFQDLVSSRWTGINEHQTYAPASLLKVPIMLFYYKQAEEHPELLTQKIRITESDIQGTQDIAPSRKIQVGHEYTIDELIASMIVYSDNNATRMLFRMANTQELLATMTDLGLQAPKTGEDYVISAKAYSLFFRVLYNATYLSREMSDKALTLLTRVEYGNGLTKLLPSGTEVAHKFGESPVIVNNVQEGHELSDCGIVYVPQKPYFLCVMTKGKNIPDLENTIQTISQNVFRLTGNATSTTL